MKCIKCGSLIPEQSKFCMTCGEPVVVKKAAPVVEKPPVRKKYSLIAMIIALLLVAIIASLIALKGRGDKLLSASSPNGIQSPVLRAPAVSGVPQPGLLQANAPNPASSGLLQADAANPPAKTGPPADVVAYLEHVKKVELYRQSMRNDFTLAIQMLQKANNPTIDPDDESFVKPNQDINKDYSSYTLKWQQIVAYFNSVQAPESCRSLAATYGQALSNYSSTYIRIQIALSKNDLSTLMSLKKSVNKDVDAGLRSADNEVSAVCRTYGITKTFTVDPDDGGDSLLSPGL